jgi:hypothetical protein
MGRAKQSLGSNPHNPLAFIDFSEILWHARKRRPTDWASIRLASIGLGRILTWLDHRFEHNATRNYGSVALCHGEISPNLENRAVLEGTEVERMRVKYNIEDELRRGAYESRQLLPERLEKPQRFYLERNRGYYGHLGGICMSGKDLWRK